MSIDDDDMLNPVLRPIEAVDVFSSFVAGSYAGGNATLLESAAPKMMMFRLFSISPVFGFRMTSFGLKVAQPPSDEEGVFVLEREDDAAPSDTRARSATGSATGSVSLAERAHALAAPCRLVRTTRRTVARPAGRLASAGR